MEPTHIFNRKSAMKRFTFLKVHSHSSREGEHGCGRSIWAAIVGVLARDDSNLGWDNSRETGDNGQIQMIFRKQNLRICSDFGYGAKEIVSSTTHGFLA